MSHNISLTLIRSNEYKEVIHHYLMFLSLIFILAINCFRFYLKKPDADLYVGRPENDIYFTTFASADIFELKPGNLLNHDFIVATSKDNLVLDITRGSTRIILFPEHGNKNQLFQLQMRSMDRFKIINESKCMSYHAATSKFEILPCTEDDISQEFLLKPVEDETKTDLSEHFVPVNRVKLEALKRAALTCDQIKDDFGAEAIAELGESYDETKQRFKNSSPLRLF